MNQVQILRLVLYGRIQNWILKVTILNSPRVLKLKPSEDFGHIWTTKLFLFHEVLIGNNIGNNSK